MDGHIDDIASLLYKDIFEVAPFGIYTLDGEGKITSFNPKMAELSGDAIEQAIGLNALEMESYKKAGLDDYFRRGLAGESFETEVRYESQLGKKISDRNYKGIPIPDSGISGQARLLLIVEDITERKRILVELEDFADFPRQNNNPVFRVNKQGSITVKNGRFDALIETWQQTGDVQPMDQLKTMAARVIEANGNDTMDARCGDEIYSFDVVAGKNESANVYGHNVTAERHSQEMREHFLSVASHELRTPMTVIGGYSDLMLTGKTGELNEIQRKYIEKINANTRKLLMFVNTMLDINKLEIGRFKLDLVRLDVAEVARRAYGDIESLYQKDGVQLHLEVSSQMVQSDGPQLGRVITNLLSNALKFTPTGGDVWLKVYRYENDVIIEVQDTGVGLSEEQRKKLFQKYSQADTEMLHKMQGTGLGLVISKELVTQMHGKIWVESSLGHGSRFFVSLPAAQS